MGGGGACPNAGRWGTSAADPTVEKPLMSAIVINELAAKSVHLIGSASDLIRATTITRV